MGTRQAGARQKHPAFEVLQPSECSVAADGVNYCVASSKPWVCWDGSNTKVWHVNYIGMFHCVGLSMAGRVKYIWVLGPSQNQNPLVCAVAVQR